MMTLREPLFEKRLQSSERRDYTYVQPDEYCRLLLSWRKMVRVDAGDSEVCGLMDLQSGKRYAIERQRLLRGS
ncbi:hypothetical protein Pla144_40360 [Bythopirellula polymerisocia]|uniref:Uncharacterized protein n=1 Tax=Bythopirellula polymerisocia TaxID=2528003 RepID=A0A5C6CH76_9BACT|nr:hypothetical protein Pla144_40360 [Bythopirellula polymerisocia]